MDYLMPWIIVAALLVWGAWPELYRTFLRWRDWQAHNPDQEAATSSQHKPELEASTQAPDLPAPLPLPPMAAPPLPQNTNATSPNDTQQDKTELATWRGLSPVLNEHTPPVTPSQALSQTEIPTPTPTPTPTPHTPASTALPQPRTPEETQVLVVDDSKVLRVKISRLLIKHGYRVSLAEDGAEAARHLAHTLPHLLITDVDMPVMNGLELSHHVRSQPHTADLPIIMITSAQEKYAPQAAAIGVKVVLSKPYRDDELIAQVTSSLNAVSQACKPLSH